MKRSKFTEAQIAFILQQAEEGTAVGEVCRKAGISESTFYYQRGVTLDFSRPGKPTDWTPYSAVRLLPRGR